MKIRNLKYIFIIIGLYFFTCNIVLGSLTVAENPSQCSQVNGYHQNGYSSTPTGNQNSPSTVSNSSWYYNNQLALEWWHSYNSGSLSVQGNASAIITPKLAVLRKYDGSAGTNSATAVWGLQNALNIVGCSIPKDCKLGKETSQTFFSCAICTYIDSVNYVEPQSMPRGCPTNYEEVNEGNGEGYCCRKTCEARGGGLSSTQSENSYLVTEGNGSGYCYKACSDGEKVKQEGGSCENGYTGSTQDPHCCKKQACSELGEGYIEKEGDTCPEGYTGASADCCKPETPNSCQAPLIPQPEGGCLSGYKEHNDGELQCCELCCSGNNYLSGDACEPSNCTACEDGTIPNADHTKCVCDSTKKCCGIKLNTVVPFIGDCIELGTDSGRGNTTSVNSVTAFPILVQGLMKILMSVIMVFSFIMIILSGLLMTTGAFSNTNFDKGKNIFKNVIISLILLGSSGLILSLINPSFFGG